MLGFLVLIVVTLLGEATLAALALPVPGAIVGLLLFVSYLGLRGPGAEEAEAAARSVLRFLPLFLVPVGVAVVGLGARLDADLSLLVGTLLVALVAGVLAVSTVMRLALRILP